MPTQYTTRQLREMTDEELKAAMRQWMYEQTAALTAFRKMCAAGMLDRIRREYERRGL